MRIATIIIGILLMLTGIYCLVNMQAGLLSLALIIGLVITAYGISQIGTWIAERKTTGLSGWVLAEGALTVLIGVLLIVNPFTSEILLAIIFASWLVVSGVLRIVGAWQTRKNFPGTPWGFMMFMGVITTLAGIYGMIHPAVAGMAIAILLGIFFILQGVNSLVFGISLPGMKNKK